MPYLNHNIPTITCLIRNEFLFNHDKGHGEFTKADVHSVASVQKRVPLFEAFLENGVNWTRRPIHAFCWKEDAPEQELDELVLWDSFTYHVGVTCFPMLKNKTCKFISRRRTEYTGKYLFTLDWGSSDDMSDTDFGLSEFPSQHKCGHFIAMENGNFAIQPNNRLRMHDPSFTVKEDIVINRKYNTTLWTAERNKRWVTPDTDIMNYDHTDLEAGESNSIRSKMYNDTDNETKI